VQLAANSGATWLAKLRTPRAVEALQKALAREKHPQTLVRFVEALLRLGEPPERVVDRARLATDARAAMKAGVPELLAWLPWSELPALHWADGGVVDADITTSWLVQAHKQKAPEAGGYVAYRHLLDATSREAGNPATGPSAAVTTGTVASARATERKRGGVLGELPTVLPPAPVTLPPPPSCMRISGTR